MLGISEVNSGSQPISKVEPFVTIVNGVQYFFWLIWICCLRFNKYEPVYFGTWLHVFQWILIKVLNAPRLKTVKNVSKSSILESGRGSRSVNVDGLQVILFYSNESAPNYDGGNFSIIGNNREIFRQSPNDLCAFFKHRKYLKMFGQKVSVIVQYLIIIYFV